MITGVKIRDIPVVATSIVLMFVECGLIGMENIGAFARKYPAPMFYAAFFGMIAINLYASLMIWRRIKS